LSAPRMSLKAAKLMMARTRNRSVDLGRDKGGKMLIACS
jgi:hypothetical protein